MTRMLGSLALAASIILGAAACQQSARTARRVTDTHRTTPIKSPVVRQVVEAAIEQAQVTLYYDPAYVGLDYPGGDVPMERGVCSDVVVRAFRKGGVDLQKEVHEDMNRNFAAYPKKWGLTKTDANIDHRRVANLMTYFERKKKALPISENAKDYLPGDVVAWELSDGGLLHIGIVTNILSEATPEGYQMAHNIGAGARIEDVLFAWKIIGHYRYF
jgi:uncharacterized protein YijF (DUF1287 family)